MIEGSPSRRRPWSARPVQGANAEAIASQNQAAPLFIEAGEGELAVQVLEHALLVIFPQVRDELGIAVRGEAVPLGLEPVLGFGIIEELAVEDGGDRAIFVVKRLLAVRETDDAEAAIGQPEARASRGSRRRRARGDRWRRPCA